jgi:hypothetical protein
VAWKNCWPKISALDVPIWPRGQNMHQTTQDADLRNLVRIVSACTLGLWAFGAGLLIGTFLFS